MKKLTIVLLSMPFIFALSVSNHETNFYSNHTCTEAIEAPGKRYRPIVLHPNYNHNRWGIEPSDIVYNFAAYTTSYDSDDDNNGDGKADLWNIPEWVAFEIKARPDSMPKYNRPSPWLTDDKLYKKGMAASDATYAVSGTSELKVVKTNNRFVRGHMCPKNAADRLGEDAGYNTHTVLNAVPQLQAQNNGIWKYLEQNCTAWADEYEHIWVISGPAFFNQSPSMWLGQAGNVSAAVPDAIYKIVIRENMKSETGVETMAFLFPNIIVSNNSRDDIPSYITSIKQIERVTKLTFLTALDEDLQKIEKLKNDDLSEAEKLATYKLW